VTLEQLNNLCSEQAISELLRCCGSTRWAKQMVERRPFTGMPDLLAAAEDIWNDLASYDWIEAFAHHPRIGDIESLRKKNSSTRQWAEGEQAGVQQASEETLKELAEGNRAYEKKFGFIFVVYATGKSAAAMLSNLQERWNNDLATELKIAAGEQNKIIRQRLQKLMHSEVTPQ